MDEITLADRLIQFGLTRQEALIYICLISNHELSGYEVAKQTGISRSNVYSSLSGLVEKGAAYLLEGSTNKYIAVSIEDFCDNKIRHLNQTKEELKRLLPAQDQITEGYITISGYKHILDKVYAMLQSAKERIYLAAPGSFIRNLKEELSGLIKTQIKVVLITDQDPKIPGCIWYQSTQREMQIRFIVDSAYVLTGDITGNVTDTCLYCGQRNFVNVFKEALRNEIKLIELTEGEEKNE